MNWQPGMIAECVIPERHHLRCGQRARVIGIIPSGRLDRDGLNGDGLILDGVPIPKGFTGFDARRFIRVGCEL